MILVQTLMVIWHMYIMDNNFVFEICSTIWTHGFICLEKYIFLGFQYILKFVVCKVLHFIIHVSYMLEFVDHVIFNNEWISYEVHNKVLKLERYVSFNVGPYIDFVFFCYIPSAYKFTFINIIYHLLDNKSCRASKMICNTWTLMGKC